MPISRRSQLECRTSLLALAIATAGASVHFAIDILLCSEPQPVVPRIHCPGPERDAQTSAAAERATDPAQGAAYLDAVERRCLADGTERCAVAHAISSASAIELAQPLLGDAAPHHVFMRYAPMHRRVVWTLTDAQGGLSIDLDAFDGSLVELTDDGVTTN